MMISLIIAAMIAYAVISVAIIAWELVLSWFQSRADLKEEDRDNIAFTIKTNLANGDYKLMQGIFNKRTEDVIDGRVLESENIDAKMRSVHKDNDLAIYQ